MNELHKLIQAGKYKLKNEVSAEGKNLIKSILEVDPAKRIALKHILSHPWFADTPDASKFFLSLNL